MLYSQFLRYTLRPITGNNTTQFYFQSCPLFVKHLKTGLKHFTDIDGGKMWKKADILLWNSSLGIFKTPY